MILYQPPTLWGLIRGAAINLLLPFINGMMLGFGELFAHEAAFRLGWGGTRVRECPPVRLARRAPARLVGGLKGCYLMDSAADCRLGIPSIKETITPDRSRNRSCREVESLAKRG